MTDLRPATRPESLLAIDAPYFYCGVIVRSGRVIKTAPIVRYTLGWTAQRLHQYCHGRGWRVAAVPLNGGGYEPST